MMILLRVLLGTLILAAGPAGALIGQSEPSNVTRIDFAVSYVSFERTLLNTSLNETEMARTNREFDALSLQFLMGRHSEAVKKLHELTASLESLSAAEPQAAAVASLRARLEPPVFVLGEQIEMELHLSALYAVAAQDPDHLDVRLRGASPEQELTFPLQVDWKALEFGKLVYPLNIKSWQLKPGRYEVSLAAPGGKPLLCSSWQVVSRPPSDSAMENALRLDKIKAGSPALVQALASTRARNRLLQARPSPESTVHWMLDQERLNGELGEEIRDLEQGKNPFQGRTGDAWRVLRFGDEEIPFRIYLSESADLTQPLPLVVAFHGAGGDENMFMEGYGNGILKRLASRRKFLLVAPRTPSFVGDRAVVLLETLLNTLSREYPLDPERRYLLGHSLGGLAVNNLLARNAGNITAACCLCGFQGFGPDDLKPPPLLVVAAGLDPIVPAQRLEDVARQEAESGRPVEFLRVEGFGHTLVVGRIMAEVLDWLFQH